MEKNLHFINTITTIGNSNLCFNLYEFPLLSEFFLGFLMLSLIIFISLTGYSKTYENVLLQFASISVSILVVSLTLTLLFNEKLTFVKYLFLDFSFLNNSLGEFSKIITCLILLTVLYVTEEYLLKNKINCTEYNLIILCAILGLIVVINANDFALIFLGLELQGIAIYLMIGLKKNSVHSLESGLKYFLLGSLSAGYFVFGWSLLYGITGLSVLLNFHFFFYNNFFSDDVKKNLIESENLIKNFYNGITINTKEKNVADPELFYEIVSILIREFSEDTVFMSNVIKTQASLSENFYIVKHPFTAKGERAFNKKIMDDLNSLSRSQMECVFSNIIYFEYLDAETKATLQREEDIKHIITLAALCDVFELNLRFPEKIPEITLPTNWDKIKHKNLKRMDPLDLFQGRRKKDKILITSAFNAITHWQEEALVTEILQTGNGESKTAAARAVIFLLRKYKEDTRVKLCYVGLSYDPSRPDPKLGELLLRNSKFKK